MSEQTQVDVEKITRLNTFLQSQEWTDIQELIKKQVEANKEILLQLVETKDIYRIQGMTVGMLALENIIKESVNNFNTNIEQK